MITILSPAKSLDADKAQMLKSELSSKPRFFGDTKSLIEILQELDAPDLRELMGISKDLAETNYKRYQTFRFRQSPKNSFRAAAFFNGGVYQGLQFHKWEDKTVNYAQDHLRILSGLYGLLRPCDLIQAYRLEMGTKLKNLRGKDLYAFWGDQLSKRLKADFIGHKNKTLINLASKEYSKALDFNLLAYPVLDVDFRERRGDKLIFISYTAKTARGLLAKYILENEIDNLEDIKAFNVDGYAFYPEKSSELRIMFVKDS